MLRHLTLERNPDIRQLLDAMPDGVLIVDGHGQIVFVNAQVSVLFGYSEEELLDRPVDVLLPEAARSRHQEYRHSYAEAPATRPMGGGRDLRARRRDGSLFAVDVSLSAVDTERGPAVVAVVRDVSERARFTEMLRRSEERHRLVVESASEVFYRVALTEDPMISRVEYVSPQCETISGIRAEEFQANPHLWVEAIHPDDREAAAQVTRMAIETTSPVTRQYRIRGRDGDYHWMADRVVPLADADGRVYAYQGVARDVSDAVHANEARARLEAQLAHAHKMEAVGRLAGGIAHDFNNLLTVILGDCEELLDGMERGDARSRVEEILHAGTRAAELTRQLLGFSRRQVITPRVLSLNTELQSVQQMVQRLVGEDVAVTLRLDGNLWAARLDPSQVAQIVVNLAANARDAMPGGGALTFHTRNVTLDDTFCGSRGIASGDYVGLSVTDTGSGMDADTLSHLFEPFFTTKPQGRGTGLGMATIYGIVTQNAGAIEVDSEPGRGTTFRLYFPRYLGAPPAPAVHHLPPTPRGGNETILLVEDDFPLRRLTRELLQRLGYTVIDAPDAETACGISAQHPGDIDLIVTDVVMPSTNGVDLAARLVVERPGIRVLFISGYAADIITERSPLPEDAQYLAKPYSLASLAAAVRTALGD